MRRRREEHRFDPLTRLVAVGLLLGLVNGIGGCVSSSRTINIAKQVNLAQATQLEISELVSEPSTHYASRLTVTDPAVLLPLIAALDTSVSLGPLAECLGQYHLSFALSTGDVQVLEYYCRGGASFLRGDQAFWSGQQATPPARFDELMTQLLSGLSN